MNLCGPSDRLKGTDETGMIAGRGLADLGPRIQPWRICTQAAAPPGRRSIRAEVSCVETGEEWIGTRGP